MNTTNPAERYGAFKSAYSLPNANGFGNDQDAHQPRAIFDGLGARLLASLDTVMQKSEQSRALVTQLQLRNDRWSNSVFDTLFDRVRSLTIEFTEHVDDHSVPFWAIEERYRVLLQLFSTVSCMQERTSPSYDQALTQWFSDTASQNSSMVNYDRYGAINLRSTELMLLQALRPSDVGSANVSLLLTSSGMAAFQILLHFFMQRLRRGDHVLLPPYIYFEASEQIRSFASSGFFCLHEASSFDATELISASEQYNARVVFLDPVANMTGLPTTDIRRFALTVSHRPGWENRIVVVDGTMVSGGFPIFDWFDGPPCTCS